MYLWLRHYKPHLAEKYKNRKLDKATYDQLVASLKRQKKADDLKTLIDFALPYEAKEDNDSFHEESRYAAEKSSVAVHNIMKMKHNRERLDAGLNLSTIMTEHRRKVLLQALTDQKLESEDRIASTKKMESYLLTHEDTPSVRSADSSAVPSNAPSVKEEAKKHNSSKPAVVKSDAEVSVSHFEPKWSDYQVMQTRWIKLQGDTKKLKSEKFYRTNTM